MSRVLGRRVGTCVPLFPSSTWILWLALAGLMLGGVSVKAAEGQTSAVQAHPDPGRELAQACRDLIADSFYWGKARLERRRKELAEIAPGIPRAEARARLAGELLRQPDGAAEAVELLTEASAELPADVSTDLRLNLLVARSLAHLQLAEEQNCLIGHNAASCVVPFASQAVHQRPQHTKEAARLLLGYLEERPTDVQAKWLLNLAVQVAGEPPEAVPASYRLPEGAFTAAVPFRRFHNRAPDLGLQGMDLAGGAIMDDFDGDGLLDLVTSTGNPCGPLRAYRNDGRGGFDDVTEKWGLQDQLGGLNVVQADYDNDGHLDLLVLRGAWLADAGRIRNSLLRNRLHEKPGRFEDVTDAAGLAKPAYPTQTGAWADYDGDGDLDLYVANEFRGPTVWPASLYRMPGSFDLNPLLEGDAWTDPFQLVALMMDNPQAYYPGQLYRNDGDGTFTDVTEKAGVANLRFAKGVTWGDYDDDGDPDLFISNGGSNRLYRNDGDGTFTDVAASVGITEPSRLAFACWFFDVDNDGDLDLFVADYSSPVPLVTASYFGPVFAMSYSVLYRNDGGRFTDVSGRMGLARPMLPMGGNFGDLDNDGWPDLLLGTGGPDLDALTPNVALRNDGGKSFQDVTFAAGFGHLQKGHGVAFGDVDNDGDQDVLHQMGGAYLSDPFANALYENPGGNERWVTLRLRGTKANSFGVGARIAVEVERGEDERRIVHALAGSGGSFGSSSLQQEIGLGDAERIVRVTVRWPGSGTVQVVENLELDAVYRLTEGREQPERVELPVIRLGAGGEVHGHAHGAGR